MRFVTSTAGLAVFALAFYVGKADSEEFLRRANPALGWKANAEIPSSFHRITDWGHDSDDHETSAVNGMEDENSLSGDGDYSDDTGGDDDDYNTNHGDDDDDSDDDDEGDDNEDHCPPPIHPPQCVEGIDGKDTCASPELSCQKACLPLLCEVERHGPHKVHEGDYSSTKPADSIFVPIRSVCKWWETVDHTAPRKDAEVCCLVDDTVEHSDPQCVTCDQCLPCETVSDYCCAAYMEYGREGRSGPWKGGCEDDDKLCCKCSDEEYICIEPHETCEDECGPVCLLPQETARPSLSPSTRPSPAPSDIDSDPPSTRPSDDPSSSPSAPPSPRPSDIDSNPPSTTPSDDPSSSPSAPPSPRPSDIDSDPPSTTPSDDPSSSPSAPPSPRPSDIDSDPPSTTPSDDPSSSPSAPPSPSPSDNPSTTPSDPPSPAPTPPPPVEAPTPSPTCPGKLLDICVVVDGSGSICDGCNEFVFGNLCCDNFRRIIEFARAFVEGTDAAESDQRFALVSFAGSAQTEQELGPAIDVLDALDEILYPRRGSTSTNTAEAIQFCDQALGDRPVDTEQALVIITDGVPTSGALGDICQDPKEFCSSQNCSDAGGISGGLDDKQSATCRAEQFKEGGGTLVSIFVNGTDASDEEFLASLATPGFNVTATFQGLETIVQEVVALVSCAGGSDPTIPVPAIPSDLTCDTTDGIQTEELGGLCDDSDTDGFPGSTCCKRDGNNECTKCDECDYPQIVNDICCDNADNRAEVGPSCGADQFCCKCGAWNTPGSYKCVENESDCKPCFETLQCTNSTGANGSCAPFCRNHCLSLINDICDCNIRATLIDGDTWDLLTQQCSGDGDGNDKGANEEVCAGIPGANPNPNDEQRDACCALNDEMAACDAVRDNEIVKTLGLCVVEPLYRSRLTTYLKAELTL